MPLIRKIIPCGLQSKGVILPKSWIAYAEQKEGKKMSAVSMEVNGSLILKPIFEKVKVGASLAGHDTNFPNSSPGGENR